MTDNTKAVESKAVEMKAKKRYMITFHEQNGDNSPVEIGHNYVINTFPRGIACEINEDFLSVVRDAKLETTRVYKDARTGDNINEVISRPAFQYSVDVI
jgi:hypothetical protein